MKDKVLIGVGFRNTHHFLYHFIRTFEKYDPGYPHELVIIDEGSDDKKYLNLLDKVSKKYKVDVRENTGRSEGTLEHLRRTYKDQYQHFFHMHGDTAFIRPEWLKKAVDKLSDDHIEAGLEDYPSISSLPVGKVGFCSYKYNNLNHYLGPRHHKSPTPYAKELFSLMEMKVPDAWQVIDNSATLWSGDLFSKIDLLWNVEEFRKRKDTEMFKRVDDFWQKFYEREDSWRRHDDAKWIHPKELYSGANWYGFQGTSEMQNCFAPYLNGFRTHNIYGDGFLQEELGWNSFWGSEYIVHYGNHAFFKRMCQLHRVDEDEFRGKRLTNEAVLVACDKIVKEQTKWVEDV